MVPPAQNKINFERKLVYFFNWVAVGSALEGKTGQKSRFKITYKLRLWLMADFLVKSCTEKKLKSFRFACLIVLFCLFNTSIHSESHVTIALKPYGNISWHVSSVCSASSVNSKWDGATSVSDLIVLQNTRC